MRQTRKMKMRERELAYLIRPRVRAHNHHLRTKRRKLINWMKGKE
jgi:hypothetical protein